MAVDSEDEETGERAARATTEVATGVGATVLAGATGGPLAGAIVAGSYTLLVKLLPLHAERRRGERESRYTESLALALAETGVGAAELAKDGDFVDTIFQTYRAAMDAIDPNVIPILGRLTAWYRGRPLDPFFRGAARTLRDLTAGDLEELRVMMWLAADLQWEGDVWIFATRGTCGQEYGVWARDGVSGSLPRRNIEAGSGPAERGQWVRVWELLDAHSLGQRHAGGSGVVYGTDQDGVLMPHATAERLYGLLGLALRGRPGPSAPL